MNRFALLARASFLEHWAMRHGRLSLADMFSAIIAVLMETGDADDLSDD